MKEFSPAVTNRHETTVKKDAVHDGEDAVSLASVLWTLQTNPKHEWFYQTAKLFLKGCSFMAASGSGVSVCRPRAPHHNASLSEGLAGRLFSDWRERGGVSVPCTHGHAVTAWLPSRVPYTQPPLDAYLWQLCAYVPRITLRPSVTVYQILQSHSTVCAINNEIMQFSNHGELLMTV